jgi:hypothetical protein
MKNLIRTGALVAVLATGAMAAMTSVASADIVCNRYGDCWHVAQRYTMYPPTLGVTFYSDDWRASHSNDRQYHWRDQPTDDRGYYENGEWHAFGPGNQH